jgi:hypothetical protein
LNTNPIDPSILGRAIFSYIARAIAELPVTIVLNELEIISIIEIVISAACARQNNIGPAIAI